MKPLAQQKTPQPPALQREAGGAPGGFPAVRMRRNRKAAWARRLVAERALSAADLIWPIFVVDGDQRRLPVAHMPGVDRVNIEEAVREAELARGLGIPAIAPFPYVAAGLRDASGSEALRSSNLMCRTVRALKAAVPDIGVITDVALDPYTSHGHDGLIDERGRILNDETLEVLCADRKSVV